MDGQRHHLRSSSPSFSSASSSSSSRPSSTVSTVGGATSSPLRNRPLSAISFSSSSPLLSAPSTGVSSPTKPPPSSVLRVRSRSTTGRPPVAPPLDQGRRRSRCAQVVQEIRTSEETYLSSLSLIESLFHQPLSLAVGTDSEILTKHEVATLFGNVVEIRALSSAFLSALDHATEPLHLVLANHLPYVNLYHPFISNFGTASSLLARLRKEPGPFRDWLREVEPQLNGLRLGDLLLGVVQRVPRYLLLMKELVESTPHDDPDLPSLVAVLNKVDACVAGLNSRLHEIEATQQLVLLHRSMTGLPPSFSLVLPGRRLIRQGSLEKVSRKGLQATREFFLFNDVLIMASSVALAPTASFAGLSNLADLVSSSLFLSSTGVSPKWRYHRSIPLEDLTILEAEDGLAIDLLSQDKSFRVRASSQPEREGWLDSLRDAQTTLRLNLRTLDTAAEHTYRRHRRRSLQPLPTVLSLPSSPPGRLAAPLTAPVWQPDSDRDSCSRCRQVFSLLLRRHHCRLCGLVCCSHCTRKSFTVTDSLDSSTQPLLRACDACFDSVMLQQTTLVEVPEQPEHPEPDRERGGRLASLPSSSLATIRRTPAQASRQSLFVGGGAGEDWRGRGELIGSRRQADRSISAGSAAAQLRALLAQDRGE